MLGQGEIFTFALCAQSLQSRVRGLDAFYGPFGILLLVIDVNAVLLGFKPAHSRFLIISREREGTDGLLFLGVHLPDFFLSVCEATSRRRRYIILVPVHFSWEV